jgi:hypothetical protein
MLKNIELRREKALSIVYCKALYFIVRMKILLVGCLFGKMKNLKHIIPFLVTLLCLATSNTFWAQDANWPWVRNGENFQITKNLEDHFSPSAASNGDLNLVVWYVSTPSGFDIYGARINKEGKILDEKGIPICTAPNDQMFPSVARDGENFLVVWQDRRSGKRWDIYGTRISIDGEVLDPDGIPIALGKSTNDQVSPALSFDGENYMVVWHGKRTSKIWNVYFTRVSKNGEVLDTKPIAVSASLKNQASPSVDFNGENYLIVWQDKRDGKFWDVYGARVTPSGEILDQNGLRITYSDEFGLDRWRPILSWIGKYYLVVWVVSPGENKWYLYGKRVGPAGEILDLVDLRIQRDGANKVFPAILWDGSEGLLVWEEGPEGDSKIFGASIIPDLKPLPTSEGVCISAFEGTADSLMPALSKTREGILVVWQARGSEGYWQIYGQHLSKP